MKRMHLLFGSQERAFNNLIEAVVLDVCFEKAVVESGKKARLGEFVRQACCSAYDLLILAPDHMVPEAGQSELNPEAIIEAVWNIKSQTPAPLIVIGVPESLEYRVLEAGAHAVLQMPLKTEELRRALHGLWSFAEPKPQPRPKAWSLGSLFSFLG